MATVTLGHAGRKAIVLDLPTVLRTRLLLTANSGGGKSWLLRRIAEQLFGKVQVLLIDPEGEFASLREKYGYVLVGKGGETPADVRSAALLAHKLLELKASAVCDLFEMKPSERHRWVRLFLEALIDAPKSLWHPVVVIVDESQMFAPEKGQGESEAKEAMISLASRGRKRGFGAVLATQRLSRLDKNVSALMLNRLIGQHFEDVDVDRALDLLSISGKAARLQAALEMRTFEPGTFYAFGRALCLVRTLFRVGPIETTHPDVGAEVQAPAPPPAPEKVKKLLPALADLPKQAEDQAKDMTSARQRIAELERELRARPVQIEPKVERVVERVEIPVFSDGELSRLEAAAAALVASGKQIAGVGEEIGTALRLRAVQPAFQAPVRSVGASTARATFSKGYLSRPAPEPTSRLPGSRANGDPSLSKAERRILSVLAQYPQGRTQTQVALLASYASSGGGFLNAVGSLRTKGWIRGAKQQLELTPDGQAAIGDAWEPLPPPGPELVDHWLRSSHFGRAEREILRVLGEVYPSTLTKEEVAERTVGTGGEPYVATGGGFLNALGKLRTLQLIEGAAELRASEDLFG
jgi:hypothetical protein